MVLTNLTLTPGERTVEFRRRNRSFEERTVTPGAIIDYEPQGWVVAKRNQSSVRLRRDLGADEILENRFWCCLYRLGYPELNISRQFKIPLGDAKGAVSKQIDVFARDDETVVVAECKTAEDYKRKSIQKDLGEFHANKKLIHDTMRKHYGRNFKPKIIWAFVVNKISLTESDITRAREYQISVITNRELNYIEEISKSLESAARQQFKAEYLSGQKIPALEDRKVPATRIRLGGKIAYVFSTKAGDILKRAFVNHRDLNDPTAAPTYQRLVKPNRLGKIREFLNGGGFFPNSILLSFQKRPRFDIAFPSDDKDIGFGYLYLPDSYKSIRVVDGQHRLFGCAVISENTKEPALVFVAMEGVSAIDEAILFTTINKEQQKVQKKLLDALEGDLKWDSADPVEKIAAISSRAIELMNAEYGGPLEDKVVSPGLQDSEDRPLTLPEIKRLIISSTLIGRVSPQGIINPTGPFLVAQKGNLDSTKTLERLKDGLNWYFSLIRAADPERWDAGREGRICNNFGVPSHIRLLGEIVRYIERRDGITASEMDLKDLFELIHPMMEPVKKFIETATEEEIERRFAVKLGSGGIKQYYFALSQIVNEEISSFLPAGFEEWKSNLSKEQHEKASQDAKWVKEQIHSFVVEKLYKIYGGKFFDLAINNVKIKLDAYCKKWKRQMAMMAQSIF